MGSARHVTRQAVILAGGRGTRLGALTTDTPKPLLDVGGVPFITHLIRHLVRFGFDDLVLLCGPFAERFRSDLGDGAAFGASLTFISDEPPAGTGGALNYARDVLASEFLMMNGDSFFDFNLLDMVVADDDAPWEMRVALRAVDDCGRYGAVVLDEGRVTAFGEKQASGPGTINAGIYLVKRSVLDTIQSLPCSMETDLIPALVERGLVHGRAYSGPFLDIGIPEDFDRAQTLIPAWQSRPAVLIPADILLLLREDRPSSTEGRFSWVFEAALAIKRLNDCGVDVFMGVDGPEKVAMMLANELKDTLSALLRDRGAHLDGLYGDSCELVENLADIAMKVPSGVLIRANTQDLPCSDILKVLPISKDGSQEIGALIDQAIDLVSG